MYIDLLIPGKSMGEKKKKTQLKHSELLCITLIFIVIIIFNSIQMLKSNRNISFDE